MARQEEANEIEQMSQSSIYSAIIEKLFLAKYKPGMRTVEFQREDIARFARQLKIDLPKNLGDLVYSFRYRKPLPDAIQHLAPEGDIWIIRGAGRAKYRFALVPDKPVVPNESMTITKVPDATPGIVTKYAFNDEQALLAIVRYNRLVDIFTGITCYSLQNHLRTAVPEIGQVETDEIYVGVDKKGVHYIFPVQAKGGSDRLSVVQTEQDIAVCALKAPMLTCRPIAAQFMQDGIIALFELEQQEDTVGVAAEKHYKLVDPVDITDDDLNIYRHRTVD
jgi:hypothetical protein